MNVNIQIDDALFFDLESCAKELNNTTSALIEKAVSVYMDKLDEIISDKKIDDIKAGRTETIPMEEVFKKAGINV